MDPKQQALLVYKSLGAADEFSRKLLVRAAQVQRGRVAALNLRLDELKKQQASKEEFAPVEAEIERRQSLADKYAKLDGVIAKAIKDRAELDEKKFK
jgi:hypothetical protein